jgi:hypothetical protein
MEWARACGSTCGPLRRGPILRLLSAKFQFHFAVEQRSTCAFISFRTIDGGVVAGGTFCVRELSLFESAAPSPLSGLNAEKALSCDRDRRLHTPHSRRRAALFALSAANTDPFACKPGWMQLHLLPHTPRLAPPATYPDEDPLRQGRPRQE